MKQDTVSEKSLFVTLTYDNKHFTKESGRITPKGFLTLNKRDFQLFMKRLRKNSAYGTLLKYYAVGEYGSNTYRPHYHAIIFNTTPDEIKNAWGLGHTHCDIVNGNTVAYTTKYMHKGKLIPLHANDDRLPEFQLLSKGLGASYINRDTIRYHNDDINRNYLTGEGGVKIPMPDFYRKKLFSDETRKKQARRIQTLILAEEEKKQQEYKAIYGSLDLYYKSQAESKRAAVTTFRNRQKERKTL